MTLLRGFRVLFVLPLLLAGCTPGPSDSGKKNDADAEIRAERAKLSPEDRALVDAQDKCVVGGGRLGEMGAPIKVMIKGQPVFLCCKSCKHEAEADPDKTLAKVEELKAKTKGGDSPAP